jgi:SAM-dependent methyltransferase
MAGRRVEPEPGGVFTGSAAFYDAVYGFKDYAAEAARLRDFLERRLGAGAPATLLDVACGTGNHLEQLRRWYAVEGLDADARLLAVAAERLPGVPLHLGDMTGFDLGREFGAVTCLFSSIGYVRTGARLRRAVASLARHVAPGGVLAVEPWFDPENYRPGGPHALFVDQPDLKLARMNVSVAADGVSVLDFHYLLATPAGVKHFTEHHELGLFTREEYEAAFRAAGLRVEYDAEGLIGRGLYLGTRPEVTGRRGRGRGTGARRAG